MNAREFLDDLRPDEIEALRGLISVVVVAGNGDAKKGVDTIKEAMALAAQARGTARSLRWLALAVLGLVAFGSSALEHAAKWANFFRGFAK